jgi:hypothetical protein
LSLASSCPFCPVPTSRQAPYLFKKRLDITFYHVIPGPLSISICSMNVRFQPFCESLVDFHPHFINTARLLCSPIL